MMCMEDNMSSRSFFLHPKTTISPTSPRRNNASNTFMLELVSQEFHGQSTWSVGGRLWCWEAVVSAMMHLTVVCVPVCKNKDCENEAVELWLQLWLS